MVEGKGGLARPSHQPCEVDRVIFPEVTCRLEHSKKQGVPGIKACSRESRAKLES